jgi:hypothetical protein
VPIQLASTIVWISGRSIVPTGASQPSIRHLFLLLYTTGIPCALADAILISLTVGLGCDGSIVQRAASEQVGRASGLSKWGGFLLVQHGEPVGRHLIRPASEWCGTAVFYPPGAAGGVFRPFGPPCQWSWTSAAHVEHVIGGWRPFSIISGLEGYECLFPCRRPPSMSLAFCH